ncbi:hypothetical protein Ccrd_000745 [Cynara cardunculus var. scolymus]|uniref:Uncharacterized protein n=1 Tax=Cynara cardunculus var. scolymus TaxID=59895 RepID=A0A103XUH5_CYNCS|nr:hypothetical protein Ccrd_000745 [Cynara cardunculus var. scolymus]
MLKPLQSKCCSLKSNAQQLKPEAVKRASSQLSLVVALPLSAVGTRSLRKSAIVGHLVAVAHSLVRSQTRLLALVSFSSRLSASWRWSSGEDLSSDFIHQQYFPN